MRRKVPRSKIDKLTGKLASLKKQEVPEMNNTQNEKIAQVTNDTMVVGIDIGSQKHWARAFDNRGMELIVARLFGRKLLFSAKMIENTFKKTPVESLHTVFDAASLHTV